MKRLLTLGLALAVAAVASARPIGAAEARRVAERVLGAGRVEAVDVSAAVKARANGGAAGLPAYYVFNAAGGGGFALVAGDDALPEVLGYSRGGTIARDDLPDGLAAWLASVEQYTADVRGGRTAAPVRAALADAAPVVDALVPTTWGQGDPFNALVATKTGLACPVGCVATAMAQVMYYWQHPAQGKGSYRYMSIRMHSGNLANSTYDWSAMKVSTPSNRLGTAKAAVSQLCYDCGVATRMQYAAGASSTYDDLAMAAMYTNFGYDATTIRTLFRECFATQQEWNAVICGELDAGRPVLMGAASSTGSESGHMFILDGYDTNGYVHVNWGWSGSGNGFYALTTLEVGSDSFSESQSVIVGIQPDRDGTHAQRNAVPLYVDGGLKPKDGLADYAPSADGEFGLMVPPFYNRTSADRAYSIGIAICDAAGGMAGEVSVSPLAYEIPSFMGMGSWETLQCKLDKAYADGAYVFRVVCKEEGFDDWILPATVGGDGANWLPAYIHDGVIAFNTYPTAVGQTAADAAFVVETRYFGLDGRPLLAPSGGVCVERQLLSDGSARTRKCFAPPSSASRTRH